MQSTVHVCSHNTQKHTPHTDTHPTQIKLDSVQTVHNGMIKTFR